MTRYLLLNRRAGKFTDQEKLTSRAAVAASLQHLANVSRVIEDNEPRDKLARRVVVIDAEPDAIARMQASLPRDAILEPVLTRRLIRRTPPGLGNVLPMDVVDAAASQPYSVTVTGGGKPLSKIEVFFYVHDSSGQTRISQATTDGSGQAQFAVPAGQHVIMVEPIPNFGFWIMLAEAPAPGSTIDCLPIAGADAHGGGWWHRAMSVNLADPQRGNGIKVGVIDTGCGPHPALAHVTLVGAFIGNKRLPSAQATDVAQHGTHTSGIIGARPTAAGGYAGIAMGAELFHARVFRDEKSGAETPDIINAIDTLSRDKGCDLINMSLGGGPATQAEEDVIRDAAERGTLCVCSAGNDFNKPVDYPGAYPECAPVSAIGKLGWAPAGTFSASNRPQDSGMMGKNGYFLAAFSNIGDNLDCAAPGVGIVSTVPDRDGHTNSYMEMDGTSMASPAACAALADILSANAAYKALPRDISRTRAAKQLLAEHCRAFGLPVRYEGRGLPVVA